MDSDDLDIPQELYDSEINFSIAYFWDAGFEVGLGLAPDVDEEAEVRTYREACRWLKEASEFAKKHRGPAKVVTMPLPTGEDGV